MQNRRMKAPGPALVISLIALFVALGGTTYAATSLPKNSVGTKQLKKNAVTSKKIKNGAVTAAKINTVGLTVPTAGHATSATNATHATSATNATHATSATSATSATHATSATSASNANTVDGEMVKKFFFTSASATTSLTTIAQFATFTLKARCSAGLPDLELSSSAANWDFGGSLIAAGPTPTVHFLGDFNQPAGAQWDLTNGGNIGGGHVTATTPNGNVITIVYQVDSNTTLGSNECLESGMMIGS
jgi:hypothetical protein